MSKVTHRTKVEAAQQGYFHGSRSQHIADELKANGIPAKVCNHGIDVEHGTLSVYEEDGMRVFEWTSDAEQPTSAAADEGDTVVAALGDDDVQGSDDREADFLAAAEAAEEATPVHKPKGNKKK